MDKITTLLLVDTKIGLGKLMESWESIYGFGFDEVYTTPDRLQAKLPYYTNKVYVYIIIRNLVNWGVFQLYDVISFTRGQSNITLNIMSIQDLSKSEVTYATLNMRDAAINHITGTKVAMKRFGESLKVCEGHKGQGLIVANNNVKKRGYIELEDTLCEKLYNLDINPDDAYKAIPTFQAIFS